MLVMDLLFVIYFLSAFNAEKKWVKRNLFNIAADFIIIIVWKIILHPSTYAAEHKLTAVYW